MLLYQYIISIDLWHGVLFRIILLTFTRLNWWKCEPANYLSNYPQAPTRISNLNTAQAVHIFVLVHVKQVCQVFPAPTHQCVVQMKYCIRSTQDLALIRAEAKRFHKLLCSSVSVCVYCRIYMRILLFGQGLQWSWVAQSLTNSWAEKLVPISISEGWAHGMEQLEWRTQRTGVNNQEYLKTYTSYFILSSTHVSRWRLVTDYTLGSKSLLLYSPNKWKIEGQKITKSNQWPFWYPKYDA